MDINLAIKKWDSIFKAISTKISEEQKLELIKITETISLKIHEYMVLNNNDDKNHYLPNIIKVLVNLAENGVKIYYTDEKLDSTIWNIKYIAHKEVSNIDMRNDLINTQICSSIKLALEKMLYDCNSILQLNSIILNADFNGNAQFLVKWKTNCPVEVKTTIKTQIIENE